MNNDNLNINENYLIKQYEMIFDSFNCEAGRFWTRFNIFIGIQIALVIGIISQINFLILNIYIFRFLIIFTIIISFLVFLIMIRGVLTQKMLFSMGRELEIKSSKQLIIVELLNKHLKLPQVFSTVISAIISLLFFIFWTISLIYFECIKYQIILE